MNAPFQNTDARTAVAGAECAVRVLRSLAEVEAAETMWTALEDRAQGATLFQSFAWCRTAAEHMARRGTTALYIVCVTMRDEAVAILPLAIQRKGIRTILTGLSEPFQQYTDMLAAPGHSPASLFALMRDTIVKSGADYVHFGQVRADSALYQALGTAIPPCGEDDAAPCITLTDWPDYETYLKSIKSKTRKNMRNARNKLERTGAIEHQAGSDPDLLCGVISRTYEGRVDWLERMGLTSRAFRNAGFKAFVDRFKAPGSTGIETVAMSLTLDGKPIAEQWGFVHKGRYYAFISNWDDTYAESSPGRLHLGEVIRSCYESGVTSVDFIIPAAPYKLTWAPNTVPVQDHVWPLTVIGYIYYSIWLQRLRPFAKSCVESLPPALRQKVIGAVLSGGDEASVSKRTVDGQAKGHSVQDALS
ncbi:MAG: GNAT family N-acetyltransferase [Rhodobiaceae bacterium]|nr:GNAT family N-acetyltransferase [Rhodobiaceae bacterium]